MIRGKIIIFFYETTNSFELNQPFKNILNKLYDIQDKKTKDRLFKLAVIKCTSAFWPFTNIWKNQLTKQSEKRYFTIYGDWNGKMMRDYMLADDDSNIMVIGKEGIIKYYNHGKISESEGEKVKNLILSLIGP
jgi:predicted transcriptional regulator